MDQAVHFKVENSIAYATFIRPDQLNSISEAWLNELDEAVAQVERDESIKAFVIKSTGKAFCVGLDLKLLERAFDEVAYFGEVIQKLNRVLLRIEALPVPVIGAVNGYARAGGFELLMAADFVLIADEAKMGDRHTNMNILPGTSGSRVPRKLGDQRAKYVLWAAPWLTGKEAVEFGLALKSVPLAQLDDAVEELVAHFRDRARVCIASLKTLMREVADLPLADAVQREIANFVQYTRDEPYARQGYEVWKK